MNCPSGYFASGGGYANNNAVRDIGYVLAITNLGNGNISWQNGGTKIPAFIVSLNQPTTGTGDGWAVGGYALQDTAVTVYAMCIARG